MLQADVFGTGCWPDFDKPLIVNRFEVPVHIAAGKSRDKADLDPHVVRNDGTVGDRPIVGTISVRSRQWQSEPCVQMERIEVGTVRIQIQQWIGQAPHRRGLTNRESRHDESGVIIVKPTPTSSNSRSIEIGW